VTLRYGFGPVGGYSDYVLVPERFFVPIPDSVALEEAAVASCSVVTAYHALVKRARLGVGESAVVVGAGGGVGLHAVQLAHRMGGHVIAVDVDPERETMALDHGADAFITSSNEGFADAIHDLTQGGGADVVVDTVASQHTMAESTASLGSGGRLVLIGYRPNEPLSVSTPDIVFREIEIYGSHWATMTDLAEVVEMIHRGLIDPIIVREFPLHEAAAALELLAMGGGPGRSILTF
jgi:D-arabinose 1-dehydrogenase-like Zn-dependent alcohol dehydrogenase